MLKLKKGILPLVTLAVAAVTLLPFAASYSNDKEGISVKLVHHFRKNAMGQYPEGKPANTPRVFKNNLGYQITLKAGYLVFSGIEPRACSGAQVPNIWHRFVGLAVANAHTPSSEQVPTEPKTLVVDSVLRADFEPLEIGYHEASPGSYCQVSVTLESADASAKGTPADVSLSGKSLYLKGEYIPPGGGQPTPFEIASEASFTKDIALQDGNGKQVPLELSSKSPAREVVVGMAYDSWLDDVDFSNMDTLEPSETVVSNIQQSLHYHTGHVHDSSHRH